MAESGSPATAAIAPYPTRQADQMNRLLGRLNHSLGSSSTLVEAGSVCSAYCRENGASSCRKERTCMSGRHVLLAPLLALALPLAALSLAAAPPAGFADALVTSVPSPTALAFTPDGRLLITTQTGQLRVYQAGALLPTPALDLAAVLCSDFERGLLGVAVDPGFASDRFIYLYYTRNKYNSCAYNTPTSPVNRVSRFVLPDSDVVDPAGEVVLVDNIPSPNGNHNAGDLHFGTDGLLYISAGDGGCKLGDPARCAGANDNARSLSILSGKLLRVAWDGGVPGDNPYAAAPGARRCGDPAGVPSGAGPCREIIAYGLRNPFRFTFRPGTNEFRINDVGQDTWEEVDDGQVGADYGWNVREGHCATGSTTDCGPPPA